MRWTNEQRRIPAATFKQIVKGVAWMLTIDFNGEGSTINTESSQLPLGGFGSHLYHDYMTLAQKSGVDYVLANGLRLDTDHTTVARVEMLLYRPDYPRRLSTHHAPGFQAPHIQQNYGEPCLNCGLKVDHARCPSVERAMLGPDCLPDWVKMVALFKDAVTLLTSWVPMLSASRRKAIAQTGLTSLDGTAQEGFRLVRMMGYLGSLVKNEVFKTEADALQRKAALLELRVNALKLLSKLSNTAKVRTSQHWLFNRRAEFDAAIAEESQQLATLCRQHKDARRSCRPDRQA